MAIEIMATTAPKYERRASATGYRLHWARPGDRYALCGSVVVAEPVTDGRDTGRSLAALTDCVACARKRPR